MKTLSHVVVVVVTALASGCVHARATSFYDDTMQYHDVPLDSGKPLPSEEWVYDSSAYDSTGSGGAIHTWTTGESLTSSDLNANFQHIHNNMVGGHGARLVDADISASANIATSKLAAKLLLPRAWGWVKLNGGVLTLMASSGVTSISKFAGGQVDVRLNYVPTDINFSVMVTCDDGSANRCTTAASGFATTNPMFRVYTFPANTNALADSGFSFAVFDDN